MDKQSILKKIKYLISKNNAFKNSLFWFCIFSFWKKIPRLPPQNYHFLSKTRKYSHRLPPEFPPRISVAFILLDYY